MVARRVHLPRTSDQSWAAQSASGRPFSFFSTGRMMALWLGVTLLPAFGCEIHRPPRFLLAAALFFSCMRIRQANDQRRYGMREQPIATSPPDIGVGVSGFHIGTGSYPLRRSCPPDQPKFGWSCAVIFNAWLDRSPYPGLKRRMSSRFQSGSGTAVPARPR